MNRAVHISNAARAWVAALAVAAALCACEAKREERNFAPPAADAIAASVKPATDFHAGGAPAITPEPGRGAAGDETDNAYAMTQGQKLFDSFNCVGCHAHGGGDKGPALMDAKWIYGNRPEEIYASIVGGRPNGMPAYGGKIPEYQILWLVAYVRSLSGMASRAAAPGREDHMQSGQPPNTAQPMPLSPTPTLGPGPTTQPTPTASATPSPAPTMPTTPTPMFTPQPTPSAIFTPMETPSPIFTHGPPTATAPVFTPKPGAKPPAGGPPVRRRRP